MLEPGSQIDKYEIIAPLAAGGMAVVYRARHQYLGREVALKILSSHLSLDDKVRERFAQEAYVQGQLDHPHIMPVLDFVSVGSVLGIVMPLIEGPSLATILADERQDPLSADDLMLLLGPVVSALSYAHGRDLIHRDLKPANVMYERKPGCEWPGRALVADFGLAKVLNTSLGPMLTRAGTTMGTPPYMSPEQYGASPEIGLQADVHALGMMAWQMLSGSLPFAVGDRMAEAKYYTGQTPLQDPESFGKGVKDSLVAEVKRACAIEVADRTETVGAFGAALEKNAGGKRRRKKAAPKLAERAEQGTSGTTEPGVVPEPTRGKTGVLAVLLCVALGLLAFQWNRSEDLESELASNKRAVQSLNTKLSDAKMCGDILLALSHAPDGKTRLSRWKLFIRANPTASCADAGWKMVEADVKGLSVSKLRNCLASKIWDDRCRNDSSRLPSGSELALTYVTKRASRRGDPPLRVSMRIVDTSSGAVVKTDSVSSADVKGTPSSIDWRWTFGKLSRGSYRVDVVMTDSKTKLTKIASKEFTVY